MKWAKILSPTTAPMMMGIGTLFVDLSFKPSELVVDVLLSFPVTSTPGGLMIASDKICFTVNTASL
jgi:hypothetical protein